MRRQTCLRCMVLLALLPAFALCFAGTGSSPLAGKDLISALAGGGYVILMRHASSPERPVQSDRNYLKYERQLDEAGRAAARSMGDAFRRLQLPVGKVLSSPAYRALETARLAQFPTAQ